jgi:hypothetical protein
LFLEDFVDVVTRELAHLLEQLTHAHTTHVARSLLPTGRGLRQEPH